MEPTGESQWGSYENAFLGEGPSPIPLSPRTSGTRQLPLVAGQGAIFVVRGDPPGHGEFTIARYPPVRRGLFTRLWTSSQIPICPCASRAAPSKASGRTEGEEARQ